MAASSLLTLIDDIAALLDDVAVLSKVAAKKTAGVLGDDLALNAQQVAGVRPDRELPVVWAVFKGSALNKLILVPLALLISAFAPWGVTALLMVGGAFLCYEGFEKLAHRFLHDPEETAARKAQRLESLAAEGTDVVALEKKQISGAVRTDFILSAEVVAITLGTVTGQPLSTQALVVSAIAVAMTIGVYGLVAGIVKLDDLGLLLSRREGVVLPAIGRGLLKAMPYFMKALSFAGTAAMFLVGGGILVHGLAFLQRPIEQWASQAADWAWLVTNALNGLVGILAGALVLAVVHAFRKLSQGSKASPSAH